LIARSRRDRGSAPILTDVVRDGGSRRQLEPVSRRPDRSSVRAGDSTWCRPGPTVSRHSGLPASPERGAPRDGSARPHPGRRSDLLRHPLRHQRAPVVRAAAVTAEPVVGPSLCPPRRSRSGSAGPRPRVDAGPPATPPCVPGGDEAVTAQFRVAPVSKSSENRNRRLRLTRRVDRGRHEMGRRGP